jgi:hypothetical protein
MLTKKRTKTLYTIETFLLSCLFYFIKAISLHEVTAFILTAIEKRINHLDDDPLKYCFITEQDIKWKKLNNWYGKDPELTEYAKKVELELFDKRTNKESGEYYKELDERLYKKFPDKIKKYYSNNN